MVTNLITVAATLITLAENVYFICFGRMILGACGAIANVAVPRFIEETVPSNEIGVFGSSINTANNFGSMVSMLMGLGLPATLAQEQQSNV